MGKDKLGFFYFPTSFCRSRKRDRERDAIPFRKNANDFRLKTLVLDTQLLNEQWLSSIIAAQGVSLKPNCDTFLKEFYYPPRESTGCFTIMVDKDRKVFGCFLIAQNGIVEKQKRFSLGQLNSRVENEILKIIQPTVFWIAVAATHTRCPQYRTGHF